MPVCLCSGGVSPQSTMRTCLIFTAVLAAAAALGYAPLRKWAAGHANPFSNVDLSGKTVIVTGANTGIGIETAKQLYSQGANGECCGLRAELHHHAKQRCAVVMACRSAKRCNGAKDRITNEVSGVPGSLETSLVRTAAS